MDQAFLKVIFSMLVRLATVPVRILPIKRNRILFTGLTGGKGYDYSCNPKYVYEYMQQHFPGQFEYVWAVSDKDKYAFLKEEGVKLVKHFTVSSFPMLLTAKVVITNGSYAPWFPFRKQQYIINTWHGGGAYKRVENDRPDANWATQKRAEFCANNIDLFLASCKVQEEEMIRGTYVYNGEVLRAGTPRNDKLVRRDTEAMAAKVRQYYKIPEDVKIILYAPTYRKGVTSVEIDADKVLRTLEQNGTEWIFLSRYHRYQDSEGGIIVAGKRVVNVMEYPDMQELLAAADILITDYSSCVWDYAYLERPCLLYVPDWKEYTKENGFYVDMERWPFLRTEDMEELLRNLTLVQEDAQEKERLKNRIQDHLRQLGSYETGHSIEQLMEKILEQI